MEVVPRKILERAIRGDLEAYERLVDQHAPIVFKLLRMRLQDESEVEVIAREIFAGMHARLVEMEDPLRWFPTLVQTVHGTIRAKLGDIDRDLFLEDWEEDPRATARTDESSSLLGKLAALSDAQQEVIRLRYLHGLSYAEIAERLGINADEVSLALRQAKARFRWDSTGSLRHGPE